MFPASCRSQGLLGTLVFVTFLAAGCGSTDPPPGADCSSVADSNAVATVSYLNDIVPFYADEQYGCTAIGCHGSTFPGSDYSLATYDDLFVAGAQARSRGVCEIKPGAPDDSYLIWKIEGRPEAGLRMPNGTSPMTPQDIAIFRQWILEGARNN